MPALSKLCINLLSGIMLAAALIYAAGQFHAHILYLNTPELLDDDKRQHFTPFVAERNPEAFNDRLLVDYADQYLPVGYRRLMLTLTKYTDAITAGKILGLTLMVVTMAAALLAGAQLGGMAGAAVTLALTMRCAAFDYHVYAGLFRSFGFPLALFQIYFLLGRHYRAAALNLPVQALFYPPLCLIFVPVTFLVIMREVLNTPAMRRQLLIWGAGGIALAGMIILAYSQKPPEYGGPVALRQAETMCEWYLGGRLPELPFPHAGGEIWRAFWLGLHPFRYGRTIIDSLFTHDFWRLTITPVLMAIMALALAIWNRRTGLIMLALAAAGIGFFLLARRYAFALGYPERFIYYSMPFIAILLWPAAWGTLRKRFHDNPAIGLTLLAMGTTIWFARPWALTNIPTKVLDTATRQELYNDLRDTGTDTLITAWPPFILDDIPLYAKREVLVNTENAHPIYTGYYNEISRRMMDTICLAFTTNLAEAVELRDRYGLTHLILEHNLFDETRGSPSVFQPYTDAGVILRRRHPADTMLFHNPPVEWLRYSDHRHFVVDLRLLPTAPDEYTPTLPPLPPAGLAQFKPHVSLEAVHADFDAITPGSNFTLQYQWNFVPYISCSRWIVFIHFRYNDEIIFTGDHPLAISKPETIIWQAGMPPALIYEHTHTVPDNAPAGDYQVRIGLFNRRTGRRAIPMCGNAHKKGAVTIPLNFTVKDRQEII